MVQSRSIPSKLGKYDEAIESYDKAIEIKPDYYGHGPTEAIRLMNLKNTRMRLKAITKQLN